MSSLWESYVNNWRSRSPWRMKRWRHMRRNMALSGEEAGRILRYRHLEETAERYQCAKIAVAHHEDDDAETVLLNLFRGADSVDFSGIRPVRGKIIRPLLCVSRKETDPGISLPVKLGIAVVLLSLAF